MGKPCNCGANKTASGRTMTYTHTAPDGKKTTYAKESDARLAMSQQGGRVTPS